MVAGDDVNNPDDYLSTSLMYYNIDINDKTEGKTDAKVLTFLQDNRQTQYEICEKETTELFNKILRTGSDTQMATNCIVFLHQFGAEGKYEGRTRDEAVTELLNLRIVEQIPTPEGTQPLFRGNSDRTHRLAQMMNTHQLAAVLNKLSEVDWQMEHMFTEMYAESVKQQMNALRKVSIKLKTTKIPGYAKDLEQHKTLITKMTEDKSA